MKTYQFFLFLTLFFLFNYDLQAQEGEPELIKQQHINILPLTYNLELPFGGKNAFQVEVGMSYGFQFNISSGSNGSSSNFSYSLGPMLELNYRRYLKIKASTKGGKFLKANSGDFIFGQLSGFQPIVTNLNYNSIPISFGVGYGIQRVYMSNFVLTAGLGLGVSSSQAQTNTTIGLISDFGLGIYLGKKKKK